MHVSYRISTPSSGSCRLVAAALLGLVLGSLSCNAILGMEERTPYPPGHGGDGADGGSGAATSTGGSGGEPAGGGGTGGGPTGGGGTGGTGGSGGDPCISPANPDHCLPREGCLSAEHCDDVVLLLHFDQLAEHNETASLAKDFSSYGNDATCSTGGPSTCPSFDSGGGRFGGAYFYSPNEYFTVEDAASLSLPDVVTVAVWFRPDDWLTGWRPLVAKVNSGGEDGNYWLGHFESSFCILFNPVGSSWETECAGSHAVDQWYLLVGTWDDPDDLFQIYVNGQILTQQTPTADMPNVDGPVTIGWAAGDAGVNGWIDEVIIWNRLLSEAEIQALYPN